MDWVRVMAEQFRSVVRYSVNISHEFCEAFVGLVLLLFIYFFSFSSSFLSSRVISTLQ